MRVFTALLVASAVLVFASCGDDENGRADENCAVTFSGERLCGESLAAWCTKFADRVDPDTQQACTSVGAGTVKKPSGGAQTLPEEAQRLIDEAEKETQRLIDQAEKDSENAQEEGLKAADAQERAACITAAGTDVEKIQKC